MKQVERAEHMVMQVILLDIKQFNFDKKNG